MNREKNFLKKFFKNKKNFHIIYIYCVFVCVCNLFTFHPAAVFTPFLLSLCPLFFLLSTYYTKFPNAFFSSHHGLGDGATITLSLPLPLLSDAHAPPLHAYITIKVIIIATTKNSINHIFTF